MQRSETIFRQKGLRFSCKDLMIGVVQAVSQVEQFQSICQRLKKTTDIKNKLGFDSAKLNR